MLLYSTISLPQASARSDLYGADDRSPDFEAFNDRDAFNSHHTWLSLSIRIFKDSTTASILFITKDYSGNEGVFSALHLGPREQTPPIVLT
jgi:hypothetical protein